MSDEEYSDLTSEDEVALSIAQKTNSASNRKVKSEKDGDEDYSLQKALKPPRATTYTAQALYDQIHDGDVNLEPEYQRDVVWTKEKQTGLIDSILRNFYIPPIIFAVNIEDDGSETKTCIDGKQRLTSIYRFMDGIIPHRDPITHEKFWFKVDPSVHDGKKINTVRLLPDRYRRAFANKQIVCVEYSDLTDENEREIFQRVQLGMALTSAEKLHVIATPRAQFIRELLKTHVSDSTLGDPRLPWDRARGSDFRCISQAVFVMSKWTSNVVTTLGSLAQIEKWLKETGASDGKEKAVGKKRAVGRPRKSKSKKGADDMDEEEEEDEIDDGDYIDAPQVPDVFKKKVTETYDIFVNIVRDPKLNPAFYAYPKVSPMEMINFAILIYVHGVQAKPENRLTPQELSSVIFDLRARVRQEHKDIRMNSRISKFMLSYIKDIKKSNIPSPTSYKKPTSVTSGVASMSVSSSAKRKRLFGATADDSDDDSDGEYTGGRTSSSRSKATAKPAAIRRKVAKATQQQPTPAPSISSGPISRRKGKDNLASLREARGSNGSISAPNPQKLPSPPNQSQSQGQNGAAFQVTGNLLSNGRPSSASQNHSRAGSTEIKSEHPSGSPSIPGPGPNGMNGGPPMPMGMGILQPGMGLQNIPPGLVEHVLGMQMMGLSPMPNMNMSQGMMHPGMMSQMMPQHMGGPGPGPGPSQQVPMGTQGQTQTQRSPLETSISMSQMQQMMQQQQQNQGQR